MNLLGKHWERNCEKFYYGIGDPKFSTLMLINKWIDSKMNENLDSAMRSSGKELPSYGLRAG